MNIGFRDLSPPASRFDGKSDGKIFPGILFLNFTVRRAFRLTKNLQISEFSELRDRWVWEIIGSFGESHFD